MRILLASASPRRKRLLSKIVESFECVVPREPRHLSRKMDAKHESMRMAEFKAVWVALKNPNALVIGADTLVQVGTNKLAKPKNKADAKSQMHMISGSRFFALSSVCICAFDGKKRIKKRKWTKKCRIECMELTDAQINRYLESKKWQGKAGSFNIMEYPTSKWLCADKQDINAIAGLEIKRLKKEIGKF